MKTKLSETITCPAGTYGLAVEPWSIGEIYAVAADWAQASSPVLAYGPEGWEHTGRQVADYQHRPTEALEAILAESLIASGDDESEAADLVSGAIEIDGRE